MCVPCWIFTSVKEVACVYPSNQCFQCDQQKARRGANEAKYLRSLALCVAAGFHLQYCPRPLNPRECGHETFGFSQEVHDDQLILRSWQSAGFSHNNCLPIAAGCTMRACWGVKHVVARAQLEWTVLELRAPGHLYPQRTAHTNHSLKADTI